ncbi:MULTISPECIES: sensor histidine kinase [unclassified Rhodococcus (in: high G+C Gram-positive bacteria)]|uniref:sensor histidine kinase n=1 Tax=unclassified Rhodococcus (in: high G+C Gram-positive bacteria) TaxID=192944 RepID=UPI0005D3B370|nr:MULTISPECIES: histidine kinase [unclassified Rhodococcus (in: high G+C Gram-positive bacteria)]
MNRTEVPDRIQRYVRYSPLVLIPCLLIASTYPGEYRVPVSYWIVSMLSAIIFVAGRRWPVLASLVISALAVPMFVADAWGLSELVPYLGAVAVVDVTMRAERRELVAVSVIGWCGSVLAGIWFESHEAFFSVTTAVKVLAYVGLPLLLGLFLRSQRELAANNLAHTRAAERSALARELHDLVAHHMASIVLRIGVAQHVLAPQDEAVREVLADVRATASDALTDIRRLLVALRDPSLGEVALVEPDAVAAEIEAALDRVRAAGFQVKAHVESGAGDLDAIGRLTLLRVIQESLTNVMKHGDRKGPVSVSVRRNAGRVDVKVINNVEGSAKGAGHGLVGMRERAELAGGEMTAGTLGDGRWEVHVSIPLLAHPLPVKGGDS